MTHAYVITHDQIAELSLLICDLDQPGGGQEIKTAAQAAHQIIMDVLGDQVGTLYDMSEAA